MREPAESSGFSLERRNPGSALRSHAFAAEKTRGGMGGFPSLGDSDPCAHPQAHDGRKQADRSQTAVGLGKEADDHKLDGLWPRRLRIA